MSTLTPCLSIMPCADLLWMMATALWNSALRQADDIRQKEALAAQQSADALDAANALAKAQATKQARRARLHQVLSADRHTLPVSNVLEDVSGGMEKLLEPAVAKMKWQVLCDFAANLRCQGAGAELSGLLSAMHDYGARTISRVSQFIGKNTPANEHALTKDIHPQMFG